MIKKKTFNQPVKKSKTAKPKGYKLKKSGALTKLKKVQTKPSPLSPKYNLKPRIANHSLSRKSNGIPSKIKGKHSEEEILTDTELLKILINVKNGNFSTQLPLGKSGTKGAICDVLNQIITLYESIAIESKKVNANKSKKTKAKVTKELEARTLLLTEQKNQVELKNLELEEARKLLEDKADQLELTSKYKSEFLANMSHELRTPLNSLKILANELIANHDKNLTEKQIQFVKTINACGEDLIDLINDVLDLSKIESGYITVDNLPMNLSEITDELENTFMPISEAKKLRFTIEKGISLPEFIETDSQRLNQILKNLLSNSFKFTEKGQVTLKIYKTKHNLKSKSLSLGKEEPVIAFEISDTGIGISEDKQAIIFEAFQQAEGSTSRKYGGTGLGLSISRGLSQILGGVIELESVLEQGSKFTLYLPLKFSAETIQNNQIELQSKTNKKNSTTPSLSSALHASETEQYFKDAVGDDRKNILGEDKVLLIAENELSFAKVILKKAHENGLKAIVITKGGEVADSVIQFNPQAILLNANLPDANAWKIMSRLKNDLSLRHIPVYMTSIDDNKNIALKHGARNFLIKPPKEKMLEFMFSDIIDFSNKKLKRLLIIDDKEDFETIAQSLEHTDIEIVSSKSLDDGISLTSNSNFDCIILGVTLPDSQVLQSLKKLKGNISAFETALIIYSENVFTQKEKSELSEFANSIILKTTDSLATLIDQATLYLHRVVKDMPEKMRNIINTFYLKNDILDGKKVLIVDDDMRNLFALTTSLEHYKLNILNAESGKEALETLEKHDDIDIILMDIMMPEMDGYQTTKKIRETKKYKDVTIIAVTAKAMKGDRQKCIESGASDYITKPVNIDQLLFLMRVWLK